MTGQGWVRMGMLEVGLEGEKVICRASAKLILAWCLKLHRAVGTGFLSFGFSPIGEAH